GAVMGRLLLSGYNNAAGEMGPTQIVVDGLPCPCGQRGCVETYASGSGFIRRLQTALDQGTKTLAPGGAERGARRLTAGLVARAAAAGDAFAAMLWDEALRYLGAALANYVTVLNPEL